MKNEWNLENKRTETFSGKNSSQMKFELDLFIQLLKEKGVKTYLEIGARHGDTFHAVVSALDLDFALAVDLPGGLWGKNRTDKYLKEAVNDLKRKGHDAKFLLGDSTDISLINQIKYFGPFDAMLIDGDHTLVGVTKDWDNYSPMANKIVAFHDIIGTGQSEKQFNNPVEVPILWAELEKKYPFPQHHTFIDTENNSAMGIGCVLL